MRSKNVIGGILFVVIATITVPLVRAWDAEPAVEEPAEPGNLLQNDWFAGDGSGDKSDKDACCSPCPTCYGDVEALFLERTNSSNDQPMIVNLRGPEDAVLPIDQAPTVLSTNDLDFDFEPGVRVLIGHRLHNGWAIEGSYLGLFDADTSLCLSAPSESTIYTFPGGLGAANVFGDVDRIWTDYSSSLHSAEANLVHCCGCCDSCGDGKGDGKSKGHCGGCNLHCRTFEWMVGFRYLNLHEHLSIYGERDQMTESGMTAVESGVYDIRSSSNLYGAQVGARARHWGRKWGWEATGKAGIFGSDVQQEQYVIDYDQFEVRPFTSASDTDVAFVGELNLTAIYRLNEVWNLRAGYNLIWITGVALAPDQLDFSGELPAGNQIDSDGCVFLHGVSCGVEARW